MVVHPFLLAAFAMNFFATAEATTFFVPPMQERLDQAEIVVRGEPREGYTDWVTHDNGVQRIYTFNEFQVTEPLKGDPKEIVVVRQPGGEKGGVGLRVSGVAKLAPGQDLVLNLGPENPDGSRNLLGLSTGSFSIQRDSDGIEVLDGSDFQSIAPQDGSVPKQWSLSDVRDYFDSGAVPQPDPPDSSKKRQSQDDSSVRSSHSHSHSHSLLQSEDAESSSQEARNDRSILQTKGKGSEPWIIWLITVLATLIVGVAWLRRRGRGRRRKP
jgi:hypothetical protein